MKNATNNPKIGNGLIQLNTFCKKGNNLCKHTDDTYLY